MEDSAYVFKQTVNERKRVARGAVNKKNGSRSKKCTTPSDYLTPAEKRKLNGKTVTYDLSKPMNWQQFREMPHDLRAEYIKKLVDMGASRIDVCDMLGCKAVTYSQWMNDHHKGERFFDRTNSKYRKNDEFIEWFCGDGKKEEEMPEKQEVVEKDKPVFVEAPQIKICSGTLTYVGDPRAVFEKVLLVMDSSVKDYKISVNFEVA